MSYVKVKLTVTAGSLEGKEFVFERPARCLIGRASDCDILLPRNCLADASRRHCLLDVDPPEVRVRDLGSRNGTYVNGGLIGQRPASLPPEEANGCESAACPLHHGDVIQVGDTAFRVIIESVAAPPASTPSWWAWWLHGVSGGAD
jgi:pSer/pThr/pTyr-binding forkhead associated (FHA) protein